MLSEALCNLYSLTKGQATAAVMAMAGGKAHTTQVMQERARFVVMKRPPESGAAALGRGHER